MSRGSDDPFLVHVPQRVLLRLFLFIHSFIRSINSSLSHSFFLSLVSSTTEARGTSVVRAFAHGAMGRWIDPSWWTD